MWGIATGTTMGLHRLRMESRPNLALNAAFLTFNLVAIPSYYFCYRKREHKEEIIELMMKANDFAPLDEMPEPVPMTDHPFLISGNSISSENSDKALNGIISDEVEEPKKSIRSKEYRAWLKEPKEWQRPKEENRDFSKIFEDVTKDDSSSKSD